jgi:CheY-like chemotaxis protein
METIDTQPRKAFLIVDDEAHVRMELGDAVRECGFEVWEAASTAEALSILDRAGETFAGLITDINMPGTRSGIVLANHAKYMWPHIEIIVVSAVRLPMSGELPPDVKFLAKPVSASKLLAAIRPLA